VSILQELSALHKNVLYMGTFDLSIFSVHGILWISIMLVLSYYPERLNGFSVDGERHPEVEAAITIENIGEKKPVQKHDLYSMAKV
jgi:hypothetical protein